MEIIPVGELKIGMFIVEPDCPWTEFNFALQGFVISGPDQVDAFRAKCRYVQIDRSRSLNEHYAEPKPRFDRSLRAMPLAFAAPGERDTGVRPRGLPMVTVHQQQRRRKFLDFLRRMESDDQGVLAREFDYIEPRYDVLVSSLRSTFNHIAADQRFDVLPLHEGLRDIAGSLQRHPDAVLWLLRLKRIDQYTFDHAIEVAAHLLMLGAHVGWRGEKLLELAMAGLLQDVGKVAVAADLLAKTEPLTPDEQHQVRAHVASSLEILTAQSSLSPEILQIVARHHERWDGSGYPKGLSGQQIGVGAEMAGLVDSFCAMLKDTPYRHAMGHQQALETLFEQRDRLFGTALMEQFVQCVGLYPVGTLVELDHGEVGVVILQNRVQRARPRLLLLLDAEHQEITEYRVLDLRDAAHAARRIRRALPRDAHGLRQHDLYID